MFSRINAGLEALGEKITQGVGTMWVAIGFSCLALVSLPAVIISGDALVIVAWIAQTFLQLVLLPIIMVGQNVQAKRTEARDQETHDVVMAEHAETKELLYELQSLVRLVTALEDTGLSDSDLMT